MEIKNVFVVGAGLMGAGIAQVSAQYGYEVQLYDASEAAISKGIRQISESLDKRIAKGKITEEEKNRVLSLISPASGYEDCSTADLLIEAVYEDLEVKGDVLKKMSSYSKAGAIIATNTSSIPVTALSRYVKEPENFLGLHFASPVPAMKILEIVKYIGVSQEALETALSFGKSIGKECIIAKDSPGFLINRLLDPMINEAILLVEQGIGSIEDVDRSAKFGLNHPMGPLELTDMAGIDLELAVMNILYEETGDPKYRPCKLLKDMVRLGYIGKKAGIGFYIYNEDGTRVPNTRLER